MDRHRHRRCLLWGSELRRWTAMMEAIVRKRYCEVPALRITIAAV
jgi:hypothetical protein